MCLSRGINRDKFPDLRNRQRASRKIVSRPISDYFNNPVPNGTEPLLQIHTRQNDTSPPPPRGFSPVQHPSTHEKAKIIRSLSTLTGMQLSSGCEDLHITLLLSYSRHVASPQRRKDAEGGGEGATAKESGVYL